MTQPSKFTLQIDKSATPANRRPNLTGEYRLTESDHINSIALWSGYDTNGRFYAYGKVSPKNILLSLKAALDNVTDALENAVDGPYGLDFEIGEAILFEDPTATPDNKRPHFYGYAREPKHYVRFSGWARENSISGTVEIFVAGNASKTSTKPAEPSAQDEAEAP